MCKSFLHYILVPPVTDGFKAGFTFTSDVETSLVAVMNPGPTELVTAPGATYHPLFLNVPCAGHRSLALGSVSDLVKGFNPFDLTHPLLVAVLSADSTPPRLSFTPYAPPVPVVVVSDIVPGTAGAKPTYLLSPLDVGDTYFVGVANGVAYYNMSLRRPGDPIFGYNVYVAAPAGAASPQAYWQNVIVPLDQHPVSELLALGASLQDAAPAVVAPAAPAGIAPVDAQYLNFPAGVNKYSGVSQGFSGGLVNSGGGIFTIGDYVYNIYCVHTDEGVNAYAWVKYGAGTSAADVQAITDKFYSFFPGVPNAIDFVPAGYGFGLTNPHGDTAPQAPQTL